jgi:hypothetical protein
MNVLDEALRRYGIGQFTDDDVVHCTGLSVRAWRELIKTRAVATITESCGRGYVRLCDPTVLKRVAVIGSLNRAGLSLAVSGQIAYSLPLHTRLYEICDPWMFLFQRSPDLDPQARLPPRVKRPKADWFNPNGSAEADPKSDWLVKIYDGRFVGVIYGAKHPPTIFGDLRQDGASFVAWWPYRRRGYGLGRVMDAFLRQGPPMSSNLVFVTEWENPTKWANELKSLGYRFEKHNEDHDPLCIAAEASIRSPVFTATINVTLAIRKALRRYLGIESAEANRSQNER